ncbi:hypothetical protein MLK53_023370 [Escherichia coli]|nr:hypothetical protein [Escherichia coli]MCN2371547.1 hypothetical protein [Escherichia coli]MCN3083643.1 hypothetical protein [Escherichia coli]MCN4864135.1 hypothetical protein [Escherichia coli]MCN6633557.1 hypothetical protein [Escherichia coli]
MPSERYRSGSVSAPYSERTAGMPSNRVDELLPWNVVLTNK